jgi:hypothetical protein
MASYSPSCKPVGLAGTFVHYADSASFICLYLYSSSDAKSLIYSLHRCFCCSVVHLSRTICERRSSCCSVSVSMFLIFFSSLIQIRFHRSNTLVHGVRHESTKRNQAEKHSPIIHRQHSLTSFLCCYSTKYAERCQPYNTDN